MLTFVSVWTFLLAPHAATPPPAPPAPHAVAVVAPAPAQIPPEATTTTTTIPPVTAEPECTIIWTGTTQGGAGVPCSDVPIIEGSQPSGTGFTVTQGVAGPTNDGTSAGASPPPAPKCAGPGECVFQR